MLIYRPRCVTAPGQGVSTTTIAIVFEGGVSRRKKEIDPYHSLSRFWPSARLDMMDLSPTLRNG